MSLLNRVLKTLYRRIFRPDPVRRLKARGLVVGTDFNMMHDVIIDHSHTWLIEIRDSVTLAPRSHILAHDASTRMHLGYTRIGKVRIGSRVFVGAGAIILPGVTVGDDVIIGAGSVVTRDIKPGRVVAGAPARELCTTDEYIARCREEMERSPRFDEQFIHGNVTDAGKREMNERMKDGIGYIV